MALIGFKKQFAALVKSGAKTQTIRKKRVHPIRVGQGLQLYSGLRTSECMKLADAVCLSIEPIEILGSGRISISGLLIAMPNAANKFAYADGFRNHNALMEFFAEGGFPFNGDLIKWELVK